MIINDRIYGKFSVKEPVLLELIKSKPVQRLKGISQLGVPSPFYHLPDFSRFEHSLGVMILLRRIKASLEEQIAGLLHDISHTAFSHVFDWVVGYNGSEDHQDKTHRSFFNNPEIEKIFKKYNLNKNKISNLERFSLLEQKIPRLCADRVDYALREFSLWANPKSVPTLIRNLDSVDGKIVFINDKVAYTFATSFLKLQREHWGGYEAVARYYLFSTILKDALSKRILELDDFYKDDDFIVEKLTKSKDREILKGLTFLKHNPLSRKKGMKTVVINKKFRYVDPEVLAGRKVVRLSQISSSFKLFLTKQRALNQKGIKVWVA
ncbi:MAG: HD domain-containing protein [Candidatus Nealsonbacteria bacterium]